jgi:hypothetical protein
MLVQPAQNLAARARAKTLAPRSGMESDPIEPSFLLERVSVTPIVVYVAALGLAFVSPELSILLYVSIPAVLILRAVLPKHRHGRD